MMQDLKTFARTIICCDEDDRKELIQTTIIKGLKRVRQGKYKENGSFKGWIRILMKNEYIDQWRKSERSPMIASDHNDLIIRNNATSQNTGELNMQFDDMWELVDDLPTRYKTAFVLHYEGYSHDEIAQKMDVDKPTATQLIFKAKKKLRKWVGEMQGANSALN